MATMNISLPDPMKQWVEAPADCDMAMPATMCAILSAVIERAEWIAAMRRLFVDEGRASGLSDETMADIRTRAISRNRPASLTVARFRLHASLPTI
jgi:antitoxin ParD1/3/4